MSIWNFLTPGQLDAGPRRVTAEGFIHSQPPPHVPPLPERYAEEKSRQPSHPIVQVADWLDQAMRHRPHRSAMRSARSKDVGGD